MKKLLAILLLLIVLSGCVIEEIPEVTGLVEIENAAYKRMAE